MLPILGTVILVVSVLASSPCSSDWDCSLNGVCQNGVCYCDPAWDDGLNCSKLQLLDVSIPTTPSCLAPGCAYHGNSSANTSTTWGGSVVKGHDGKYHMYVSEMANNCGLGNWLTNSRVAHTVSDTPLGPFNRLSTVVDIWSHNPEVAVTPGKDPLYLVFNMGNGHPTGNISNCNKDDPAPTRIILPKRHVEGSSGSEVHDDQNQTIVIHSSPSPSGPWTPTEAQLVDIPPLGNWNPSVTLLPNGTVRLMFLDGGSDGIQVLQADDWRGPYFLASAPGKPATTCSVHRFKWCVEDGFLYQDTRNNWHALFHMFDYPDHKRPEWCGGHAFSRDGLVWSNVTQAYNNSIMISYPNQTRELIWAERRERPKLLFDDNGVATHIYNGVDMPGYGTYTFVQRLAT